MSRRLAFGLSAALLATIVGTAPAHAATTITDLGGLPGAPTNWATAINDAGVAVGGSSTNGMPARAVKFDGNGGAVELTGPAGASNVANAINNRGVAVGTTTLHDEGQRAIRFNADGTHTVLIAPYGFVAVLGLAIDDYGTVYGTARKVGAATIPVRWRPNGVLTSMKLPDGANWGYVSSVSPNGYVAGYVSDSGRWHKPVRWNPDGSVTVLAGLEGGGGSGFAHAVNRYGEVVGEATDANGMHGVFWAADGSVSKTYGHEFYPRGVNDDGVAVGYTSKEGRYRPFLWKRNGEVLDLGLPDGADSGGAVDINNDGVMVGWAGPVAVKWTVG
jgi:uncharacterized membrane protein